MINGPALQQLIPRLVSRPFRQAYFRAMQLRHHGDPLGRNRPIARQRFNVNGGARVLYLGDNQVTCLHEVQAFGFPATSVAIVPVQLHLNAVLDLRDPNLLRALQVTTADVGFNFRSLPPGAPPTDMQALGEALAASSRVDGLLYDSLARPGSACLAVLEAGVVSLGSVVEVNDAHNKLLDRLP